MLPQMFPDIPGEMAASVRPGAFLSCSSDSTIRLWHVDERTHVYSRNILSTVSLTSLKNPKKNIYNTIFKKNVHVFCFVVVVVKGPLQDHLYRHKHGCIAGSRKSDQHGWTAGGKQGGRPHYLCQPRWKTLGVRRPRRNSQVIYFNAGKMSWDNWLVTDWIEFAFQSTACCHLIVQVCLLLWQTMLIQLMNLGLVCCSVQNP